ncbi:MAG TPA: cupin domain-containing protein [Actinomycetota bacterium]
MQATSGSRVVGPEVGDAIDLGGLGVVFKIAADQTGGSVSIVEHPMEPGRLVPPHVHGAEDEVSYVLEGRFGARIGDVEGVAGPGSYIIKPRGVPHTFWNPGPDSARMIEIIVPSGFERFFHQLGDLVAAMPEDFEQRRAELGRGYDLSFVPEWIPELKEKYGLKLLGE